MSKKIPVIEPSEIILPGEEPSQEQVREEKKSKVDGSFGFSGWKGWLIPRILLLVGACLVTLWVALLIPFFALGLLMGAISFFQIPEINRSLKDYFSTFLMAIVALISLIIGVIWPALGIGLFALFIAKRGHKHPGAFHFFSQRFYR